MVARVYLHRQLPGFEDGQDRLGMSCRCKPKAGHCMDVNMQESDLKCVVAVKGDFEFVDGITDSNKDRASSHCLFHAFDGSVRILVKLIQTGESSQGNWNGSNIPEEYHGGGSGRGCRLDCLCPRSQSKLSD